MGTSYAGAVTDAPLEIGVTPWLFEGGGLAEGLAAQGERAEALGFHSLFLPEHHFGGPSSIPSPLLLLAAVAARTRTLKLGTTSYLLPLRHPLHAAAEVAVLDRLSGGRVILGVGRGFRRATFEAFGVPVAEKRNLFEVALAAMVEAWEGAPVAWEGEGDQPLTLAPRPAQKPHPPIWVAAFGPKAMAQAGRLALPYLASPIEPMERLAENLQLHREACEAAGRELPRAVPIMRSVFVSRDVRALARASAGLESQAAALAKSRASAIRSGAAARLEDWALVGEPERVVDRIALYRERFGMTHLIARTQIPGLEPADLESSLEHLSDMR